ncbi:RNA polymerase sporulation-specific sigma factor [Anaerosphaera aminiphila DSM 21120]|uniref:RNA polymerase sporulation-specific sigma factor n=1 Tax=Anaerosphaera aminiphila DSM 21120 TaxID=1120995 RepID=A0A1M5TT24_9FIRM|nr:sigma-70 family RNA polymerase sigma factor [Anaerosphaera aminiphila]SHH53927.1 RNA polymerase sporulation-specific sigma factor [Anaerosphaera aminiphila DSM 21120]
MYEIINELYLKARSGDRDAKAVLVSKLNPLIKSSIKKYCPIWDYFEDLYQDGVVVVLKCIELHNENKGTYLNFVKNYLRFYYLNTFKYLLKDENGKVPMEDEREELNLLEFLEDDFNMEEHFLNLELSSHLKLALNKLTHRQRQVVVLYYHYNFTHEKIGNILEISKWTVVNTKRRAIEILKEELLCI